MEYLVCAIALYLGLVGYMYWKQRAYIYFPSQEFSDTKPQHLVDFQDISVETSDGLVLKALYMPPEGDQPVIVFFHGNAGNIYFRGYRTPEFIAQGYGFLLAEYRGYAGNEGEPSEENLYIDGRAYMNWLIKEQGIPQERVVVYAESLGTGVATQMALEYENIKALVLEAPFTTLPDIGQKYMFYLPVRLLAKDRYDNKAKIAAVKAPLLLLHGRMDGIVPYEFGKALFKAASEPKTMESYPAGNHINLHEFGAHERIIHYISGLK